MELLRKAAEALNDRDKDRHKKLLREAYSQEKAAAGLLISHIEAEPTRGVLFRSAASMALELGLYNEANELIQTGLDGKPYDEIKAELLQLQEKVSAAINKTSATKKTGLNSIGGFKSQKRNVVEDFKRDSDSIVRLYEKIPKSWNVTADEFVDFHKKSVKYLNDMAFSIVKDREIAERIVADAYEQLDLHLATLRGDWKLYIYAVVKNKIIGHLLRIKKKEKMYSFETRKYFPIETERSALKKLNIDILPEGYRELLIFRYIDRMTIEQISKKFGLSKSTISKRLFAAKKLLLNMLRDFKIVELRDAEQLFQEGKRQ